MRRTRLWLLPAALLGLAFLSAPPLGAAETDGPLPVPQVGYDTDPPPPKSPDSPCRWNAAYVGGGRIAHLAYNDDPHLLAACARTGSTAAIDVWVAW